MLPVPESIVPESGVVLTHCWLALQVSPVGQVPQLICVPQPLS